MNRREFLKSAVVGIGAATVPIVARLADTENDPFNGALVNLRAGDQIIKNGHVVGWINSGRGGKDYDLDFAVTTSKNLRRFSLTKDGQEVTFAPHNI